MIVSNLMTIQEISVKRSYGPMAIVRSKDCKTTHEGFDGYGERTLLDEASGSDYIKMGDLVFEPGSEIGRHRHQAQEAFVVTEGTGTVWLGEEEALLSVGDAMLVPSGVSHAFKNDSGRPWRMVWAYGGLNVGTEFENAADAARHRPHS